MKSHHVTEKPNIVIRTKCPSDGPACATVARSLGRLGANIAPPQRPPPQGKRAYQSHHQPHDGEFLEIVSVSTCQVVPLQKNPGWAGRVVTGHRLELEAHVIPDNQIQVTPTNEMNCTFQSAVFCLRKLRQPV